MYIIGIFPEPVKGVVKEFWLTRVEMGTHRLAPGKNTGNRRLLEAFESATTTWRWWRSNGRLSGVDRAASSTAFRPPRRRYVRLMTISADRHPQLVGSAAAVL